MIGHSISRLSRAMVRGKIWLASEVVLGWEGTKVVESCVVTKVWWGWRCRMWWEHSLS